MLSTLQNVKPTGNSTPDAAPVDHHVVKMEKTEPEGIRAPPSTTPPPAATAGMVTITIQIELPSYKKNLNQVLSVSLLMTSSTALGNEELYELTRSPLLARAVEAVMSKETTETKFKFCLLVGDSI